MFGETTRRCLQVSYIAVTALLACAVLSTQFSLPFKISNEFPEIRSLDKQQRKAAVRPPVLKKGKVKPNLPTPVLTELELLTIQYYTSGVDRYLEWGSGASTVLIGPMAQVAYSIDSSKSWCDMMLEKPDVQFWIANGKLRYYCVDIGPTGAWGIPTVIPDDSTLFRNYTDVIDGFGERLYDTVFVDGRFRVACALKVLDYVDTSSIVLIHDYSIRTRLYGAVLEFYDVVEQADTLVVLRPKLLSPEQRAKAKSLLRDYQLDYQ